MGAISMSILIKLNQLDRRQNTFRVEHCKRITQEILSSFFMKNILFKIYPNCHFKFFTIAVSLFSICSFTQAQEIVKSNSPQQKEIIEKSEDMRILNHLVADKTMMEYPKIFRKLLSSSIKKNETNYVADTVITLRLSNYPDTIYTTRYSYTYDKSGKLISELLQNEKGANIILHESVYDPNGNCLSYSTKEWTNDQWVDQQSLTYTYDDNRNMLTKLDEYWMNGVRSFSTRDSYNYDTKGSQLSWLHEMTSNGQFVNSRREICTYDDKGNRLTYLLQFWINGQWENNWYYIYTYDTNGNQLTYFSKVFKNGQWVDDARYTYTYDSSNNQLSWLSELCIDRQWKNSYRSQSSYDSYGSLLSFLRENWSDGKWVNGFRDNYVYDFNGDRLAWLNEIWSNEQFVNSQRETYTYDEKGNRLNYLREYWIDGQWVDKWHSIFTYDINGMLTFLHSEECSNSNWYPLNYTLSFYDSVGNTMSYWGHEISLHYKKIITDVTNEKDVTPETYNLSQNYPNPFNPTTSIDYDLPLDGKVTLNIYDMLGCEVKTLVDEYQQAGKYTSSFDAGKLSSGIYVYKIVVGTYSAQKKMLLLK